MKIRYIRYIVSVIILLITILLPIISFANSSLEKEELARIKNILESTKPLINTAQAEQMPNKRVQFHYDWLRNDIDNIVVGINQKLTAIQIEPRSVKPLKDDYLSMRSAKQ